MAKAKKEIFIPHVPPSDLYIYFYVGDKYYKRLQPIPYKYQAPDFKKIKINLK
jgi:hypothetical protein